MDDVKLIGTTVHGMDRCPQCGVSNPLLTTVYKPSLNRKEKWGGWFYATVRCSKCLDQILIYGHASATDISSEGQPRITTITVTYPSSRTAAESIPARAKNYLQQAIDSLHAPDGAVMLAASSVDAMLKDKGYKENSLYSRIDQAHKDGLLTEQMREWAHEIRLSANEQRHADDDFDGASADDAKQTIEFAEALGEYLFVLPGRVTKWKSEAKK